MQVDVVKEDYELAKQLGLEMRNRPSITQDANKLSNLLADVLKGNALELNVLKILLNEGIIDRLARTQETNESLYNRYVMILEQRYGTSTAIAQRTVWIWLYSYRGIVLGKEVPCQIVSGKLVNSDATTGQSQRSAQKSADPNRIHNTEAKVKFCPTCGLKVAPFAQQCPAGHPLAVERYLSVEKKQYENPTLIDGTEHPAIYQTADYQEDSQQISFGQTIKFGRYPQGKNRERKDIEWLILQNEETRVLVISKYGIDCHPYNSVLKDVTWETCSLRKWLNGPFINAAFTAAEKRQILSVTVTADQNWAYNTDPGRDTTDQVFLLSITESNIYFPTTKARKCVPTEYAISQGTCTTSNNLLANQATCYWWLRSPGYQSDHAAKIFDDGRYDSLGTRVQFDQYAVRPALWINLASLETSKRGKSTIIESFLHR